MHLPVHVIGSVDVIYTRVTEQASTFARRAAATLHALAVGPLPFHVFDRRHIIIILNSDIRLCFVHHVSLVSVSMPQHLLIVSI